MAFYGVAANLVVYLTTELHEDTVSSVRNVNNWSGSVWMTPIIGAYIADTYLGRFWTFTISSLIYVMVWTFYQIALIFPRSKHFWKTTTTKKKNLAYFISQTSGFKRCGSELIFHICQNKLSLERKIKANAIMSVPSGFLKSTVASTNEIPLMFY